jgi:hypothetical protein
MNQLEEKITELPNFMTHYTEPGSQDIHGLWIRVDSNWGQFFQMVSRFETFATLWFSRIATCTCKANKQ